MAKAQALQYRGMSKERTLEFWWCHLHIENSPAIATPLQKCTHQNEEMVWGNAKEGSADELENHLCHAPVLPDPFQLSFKQPEEIETEASGLWERRESNQYLTIVIGFGVVFRGSPKFGHV